MEDKNTGGFADVKIEPVETAAPPKVPLKRQAWLCTAARNAATWVLNVMGTATRCR